MTTGQLGPQPAYLALRPQTPTRVRIVSWRYEDRPITDPLSHQLKTVRTLVLDVSEVDGQPQATTLSFVSFKAQNLFDPHLRSGEALRRTVEVTWRPRGYATEYEFRLL